MDVSWCIQWISCPGTNRVPKEQQENYFDLVCPVEFFAELAFVIMHALGAA